VELCNVRAIYDRGRSTKEEKVISELVGEMLPKEIEFFLPPFLLI
jgi:hypothetical protein